MRLPALLLHLLAVLALSGLSTGNAQGQQIHRYPFETRDPAFVRGTADAHFNELVHEITNVTAHGGQASEHLQFVSEQGNNIYYYYPTPRAPLGDELSLTLWVKGSRPGAQLLARLVLPKERNPANLDEPLTTLLRGDAYQKVSRWEQLELRRPVTAAQRQRQVLRDQLKREVDFTDAYIDRIVLNAYSGPGMTELWLDDLEIGPVAASSPFKTAAREKAATPGASPAPAPKPSNRSPALVELIHDQLRVNGKPYFPRGVRYTDTSLAALRRAGFTSLWLEESASPALLDEAVQLGFWIVPMLHAADNGATPPSPERLRDEMNRFLDKDAVLAWHIGDLLTVERAPAVAEAAREVRAIDPNRPIGADIWDGQRNYARSIDLEGMHRWPLFTSLELTSYRDWLTQRRNLGRSSAFTWTWVQTHLPEWYSTLVYERPTAAGYDEPIGPQPEQVRLLTYVALAAGCRGLGFWSDRFLADSHQGRDRLLETALLNLELKMLEPILVTSIGDPTWIDTSEPEVKAAVLRTNTGLLVLPMWLGRGAQYVPGQSAKVNLKLTVPQAPAGTQPWEVTPGLVRSLYPERVPGGVQITIPEFGLTTAVVFTADNERNGLIVRFQDQAKQNAKLAAEWAEQLAEESIRKVSVIYAQLVEAGHGLPDGAALLESAQRFSRNSKEFYQHGQYREAYGDADRALRPLRILMRGAWNLATRELSTPVASPYALSYYTLPRHWKLMDQVKSKSFGANLLTGGDFEMKPDQPLPGWVAEEAKLDEVEFVAKRVADQPHLGKQCLMLQITPKDPQNAPAALERCLLAIHSPMVSQPPGTWVRVSGWVRIPKPLGASVDGALLYDSAGGEPLAIRMTEATPWKPFVTYRQIPASGQIQVTVALSALGTVYFDDLQIEPLLVTPPQRAANP
jgi:hypothetical protein